MKKLLAVALTAFLMMSFAGCSKETPQSEHQSHTHTQTEPTTLFDTEPQTTSAPQATSAEPDSTVQTESSAQPPTTTPGVVVVSDTLERGITKDNTYTSATLGLTFTKPSAWAFAEESDLAYYSGIMTGGFGDFAAAAKENPAVYDMYATDKNGCTISICYENLQITTGATLTSQEYAQIIKTALSETPDTSVITEEQITLGARSYTKLAIKSSEGETTTVRTYYLTLVGDYMATIIASAPENSEIQPDNLFS